MSAVIIDGKATSKKIREGVLADINKLSELGVKAGLAVVIVGDNPASRTYVNNKKKACAECGIYSEEYALPEETTEEELLALIDKLNKKEDINGILVQLPLPKHISEDKVIAAINPDKDVDAFHVQNVGKIMTGDFDFLPCTPAGVMALFEEYGIDVSGKRAAVIGRSNIVGKPMSMLLLHKNATVTICHSRTKNIEEILKSSDIIVAAVGREAFLKGDMVSEGCVVIDVGINRNAEGKLCGDVDYEEVSKKASFITPVPGGVGPMTITMLMKNTLKAACLQNNINI
ncbi:MAG: bifunctional methylenetetrahydrofolate dehydrogenase/methenyltetrahydrofolate cyclohydrolase FolD [Oscillospiraceae bacterium]|nr:bifunctional methylenetetrahydrofolate dehydrogenase/methenyltetrahydrofolate cyclohydrolase FolD [Oscillospiraceae bacterium]